METKSIQQRAKELSEWILRRDGMLKNAGLQSLLERELEEQDAIARKEERERCIKAAMEASCGACCFYHEGNCIHSELAGFESECSVRMKKIRNAMEFTMEKTDNK